MLGKNFGGLNLFTQFLAYWNVIISQTAAWFALVASEQASVAFLKKPTFILPIGSYIQVALNRADFKSCLWAVLPY